MKKILITGASGFVGSHVLRHMLKNYDYEIICLNTFRHKGLQNRIINAVAGIDDQFKRVKVITCDLTSPVSTLTSKEIGKIDYVLNLASESHVDRSIEDPANFIQNNVSLMCNILDWARLSDIEKFIHVSTDEVYGPYTDHSHLEWDTHYPSNPYSASKSAQESIAFSYWRTYGVPLAITNTMNMFGEMQDPEKYIPMVIKKIMSGERVAVHASSEGVVGSRHWLYAGSQADGLAYALSLNFPKYGESSMPEKWHIVGQEFSNLEIAQMISSIMKSPLNYELVDFHTSRPGHDLRYSMNGDKIIKSGWSGPEDTYKSLEKTVNWYIKNPEWLNL